MTPNENLPDILSALIVSTGQTSQVWQTIFPLPVTLDTGQEDREENNTDSNCNCCCVLHNGKACTVVVEEEGGII